MAAPHAPQEPETTPGTVLAGKYRIDQVIGRGGMGVVVAATHLGLEQRVALKFLLPAALGSVEATERFAREARAAVRLRSEHVARVFDVGQMDNGAPYIVMEFLDGSDLADRIAAGPVGIAEAVDFVLQASEALAEAHGLGIVHRDLKPRNLFLTRTVHGKPLVKVLDFGISKLVGAAAAADELSLTRTSAIMGSPNYMSPEQLATPRNVDERTDVWSLGVILYELIAGRLPFIASTITELCARVFQEEPIPLNVVRAEVPAALSVVVMRALSKKLDQRWSNVQEMAGALAPFAADPTLAARVMSVSVGDRPSVAGGGRRASTFGDRPLPASTSSARVLDVGADSLNATRSAPPSGSLPGAMPQGGAIPPSTSVSWSDANAPFGSSSSTGSQSMTLPRTRHLAAFIIAAVCVTAGIATALALASAKSDDAAAMSKGTNDPQSTLGAGRSSASGTSSAIVVNTSVDAAVAPPLDVAPASASATPTASALATPIVPSPTQATRPAGAAPARPKKPKATEDNNLADDRH